MNHNRIAILSLLLYRHSLPTDSIAMTYRELIDIVTNTIEDVLYTREMLEQINRLDIEGQHVLADKILLNRIEILRREKGYIDRLLESKKFPDK